MPYFLKLSGVVLAIALAMMAIIAIANNLTPDQTAIYLLGTVGLITVTAFVIFIGYTGPPTAAFPAAKLRSRVIPAVMVVLTLAFISGFGYVSHTNDRDYVIQAWDSRPARAPTDHRDCNHMVMVMPPMILPNC